MPDRATARNEEAEREPELMRQEGEAEEMAAEYIRYGYRRTSRAYAADGRIVFRVVEKRACHTRT